MLPEVVNYSAQDMANHLYPLIKPLKDFEGTVDQIEKEKKQFLKKTNSITTNKLPLLIGVPIGFWLAFTIIHAYPLVYSGSSFAKLLHWGAICFPAFFFVSFYVPRIKKEKEELKIQHEESIAILEQRKIDIATFMCNDLASYIPPNYQYSIAVEKMYEYLVNGRARNLTEAINIYEDDMHKLRMENMQGEILRQQKCQTVLATVSAVANVSTAMSAASAASSLSSINAKM